MLKVSSDAVAQQLDQFARMALTQSIVIEQPRQPAVVMLSLDEYQRLQALDDAYLAARARQANKEGYLDHDRAIRQRLAATMNERRLSRNRESAVRSGMVDAGRAAEAAPADHP